MRAIGGKNKVFLCRVLLEDRCIYLDVLQSNPIPLQNWACFEAGLLSGHTPSHQEHEPNLVKR